MGEAPLEQTESGLRPAGDGWFVVNVRDAAWRTHDAFGSSVRFESLETPFEQLGINIRVLEPGQPNGLYHRESLQEDFLVLHGECVLLVDGEERSLRAWDFVHLPPGTDHIVVGAGEGPCAILMTGARTADEQLHYPRSGLAARHGASAAESTDSPGEAYATYEASRWGRPAAWDSLPWAER